MKKLFILILASIFLLSFAYAVETELDTGQVYLGLDLGDSYYLFGLSSNPINSATSQPNDVTPTLQPVETSQGSGQYRGIVGDIDGNPYDNELHFYWNVSSPESFKVELGVQGAMKKVSGSGAGDSKSDLNWTIYVDGDGEPINKDNYNNRKLTLYKHNPEVERVSYSSKEIKISTEVAEPGTYNGNLIFSIGTGE